MKTIFKGRDRKRAETILVILASQSVEAHVHGSPQDLWEIRVRDQDYPAAAAHIDRYDRENRPVPKQIKALPPRLFYSPAVLILIGILTLVHLLCMETGRHDQAVFQFGASSYFLSQGETFRAVTALFLHSDTRHLLGNAAGLLVLGSPLIRLSGYGTGLFLLLCAGTTGNLIAAGLGQDARLSIGASTAVMAAAGLLAARQMLSGSTGISMFSRLRHLFPLAGAATLVAMFSHGERTDVAAHFFGFAAGWGIGLLAFPLAAIWSGTASGTAVERTCLGLTLVITISALIQGI